MTVTLNNQEFVLIRDLIEKECGIRVEENKVYLIESRLAKLVMENQCGSFQEFYTKAKSPEGALLKNKIVDAMTTNETLWFRDSKPFQVMKEVVYPEFMAKIKSGQRINMKLWSAACSTGQEPYSLVMTALEAGVEYRQPEFGERQILVTATDISPSAVRLAKMARYDRISISRGMTDDMKDKYFEQKDMICSPKPEVKKPVSFSEFNLQDDFTPLGKFDVIFLRNVAIYFSREFKAALYEKLANALNPGGYLFLGASESMLGFQTRFKTVESNRCLYYQLKD